VLDGDAALQHAADLTRRIVQVPKSELPTDARKQPEQKQR
jgi:hypothetical protein